MTYEYTFPRYADLVCPFSTLSLKTELTPFTFKIKEYANPNKEKFYLPLVSDSVSKDKLDDETGLTGCGPRIYRLKT